MSAEQKKNYRQEQIMRAAVWAVAGAAALTVGQAAFGDTYRWTRGANNNNWDGTSGGGTAFNWVNVTDGDVAENPPDAAAVEGGEPAPDILYSGTMVNPNNTTALRRPYTVNSITFNSDFGGATNSYGISAVAQVTDPPQTSVDLTIGAGGLTVHNFGRNVNINAVTLPGVSGLLKLSADQTWNIDLPAPSSGALTVGIFRPLVGSVTMTKVGTGILILSKGNTGWSGDIVLNEGSIRTGGGDAPSNHFGTGTVIHESANDVSVTASTVSPDGGGGDRTFSNNFRLGGTGQFTFGGSFNINTTLASTVTLTSDKTINFANGTTNPTYVMDAKFTGAFGFTKGGNGTVLLNNAANDYTGVTRVSGSGPLVLANSHALGDGSATNNLAFNGGTLRLAGPMSMSRSIAVENGGGTIDTQGNDVTVSGGMSQAGTGVLHKAGSGTLTVPHVRAGGIAVDGGKVLLTANGGNGGVSKVGSVDTTAGTLDLNDNDLVVDYAEADPNPTDGIRLQLKAGRDSGWVGPGIVSKAAKDNAAGTTTLGYASAADVLGLSGAATATWGGQTVDASAVLVKYTYYGDANLNGKVDRDDMALADRGAAMAMTGWQNGDFDYDGTAGTAADYALLDKGFAAGGGVLSADLLADREARFGAGYVSGLVASVPEPTAGAIVALITIPMAARRRRCR